MSKEEKKVIENLYKNSSILILRQDKGRGFPILNWCDYVEKAESFLAGEEFEKLDLDPTKSFKSYVQRNLLRTKKKFGEKDCTHHHPVCTLVWLKFINLRMIPGT